MRGPEEHFYGEYNYGDWNRRFEIRCNLAADLRLLCCSVTSCVVAISVFILSSKLTLAQPWPDTTIP